MNWELCEARTLQQVIEIKQSEFYVLYWFLFGFSWVFLKVRALIDLGIKWIVIRVILDSLNLC